MAYNLSDRFPPPPKCINLLDPGAYEVQNIRKINQNKFPFLSNTPRNTQTGNTIWTHSLYYADQPSKIQNCTTFQSKRPRFSYEAFSKADLKEILCRCGIKDPCECLTEGEDEKNELVCQAKVPKYLFKGRNPRLAFSDKNLLTCKLKQSCHQFYDARVNESTAYYHGCKWSKRTSKRSAKSLESRPGPADYTIEKGDPTYEEICAERVRHHKRKTSKQLRFIEMIQERNISEGMPGPARYDPELPKCRNTQYYGPKHVRFPTSQYDEWPGPADYILKRDFELPVPPEQPCNASLPEQSCFGIKAQRFKYRKEENPSPASYNITYKACHFVHCETAPFGSSATRFKENAIPHDFDEKFVGDDEPENIQGKEIMKPCLSPTWVFKSKTIRMKPLTKKPNEVSPADLPQSQMKVTRLPLFQYIAPFFSSEGRFQPWYNWMPVFGRIKTPGPAYYCIDSKSSPCIITRGPLVRTARFPSSSFHTPAPNKYNVGGGIESTLFTHNIRLKCNMEKQHEFIWKPPMKPRKLNLQEQEMLLLTKSIRLLDFDIFDNSDSKSPSVINS